jgi:hypothetical protein
MVGSRAPVEALMRRKTLLLILTTSLALVATLWTSTAQAQRRRGPVKRGVVVFVGGYFYDPFYGPYPWWSPAAYPYRYYPVFDDRAEVRVLVTPKEAAVYVDGYYAGIVGDFDGFFQRLPLTPGPHAIDVYLPAYRTLHQQLYLGPNSTYSLRSTMERLAQGEISDPPTVAPPIPPPPPGTARLPRTRYAGPMPPPISAPQATAFGTLAIRVQPADAEITIDGEFWNGSEPGDRLLVQLGDGTHHVEIQKHGFRTFSTDVRVRAGETASINVSLSAEGKE